MANYLARVELHNAKYEDYETLHEVIGQRGFARTIVANDGRNISCPQVPTWRRTRMQPWRKRTVRPRQPQPRLEKDSG